MHIDLRSSSTSSSTQHLTFSLTTDRPSTGSVSCTDCTKITASLAVVRQRNFSFYYSYDIFFSKKYRNQSQTELLNSNSAFSKSFEILRVFCNHRKKIFSLSCLSICETITELHSHTFIRLGVIGETTRTATKMLNITSRDSLQFTVYSQRA